ncbi:NAD-dependent epimerase/dehydratase family protein [Kribbella sp. NPDC026611]|uniref:NAD-dependent epimerase/dehydratase family protein n=1 Tax=Kribbella sp. NPDC026611 TaxID=3154911 RepID=UPI0034020BE8
MTRALVTGATGYTGGRLVPELLSAGYDVRVPARRLHGELCWAAVGPFHDVVFGGMRRNITHAAEQPEAIR